jgi:hypothetical protein
MVFLSETEKALELAARSMPKNETMPEIELIGTYSGEAESVINERFDIFYFRAHRRFKVRSN